MDTRYDRPQFQHSRSCAKRSSGQMTIEFVLFFPVILMIALIAFNGILFLAECSGFDRIFREATSVFAPSPASDATQAHVCAQIEEELDRFEQKPHLSCSVTANAQNGGLTTYSAKLFFTPTIFGAYPLRKVFEVELPPLEHSVQIVIDTYKPGVFL